MECKLCGKNLNGKFVYVTSGGWLICPDCVANGYEEFRLKEILDAAEPTCKSLKLVKKEKSKCDDCLESDCIRNHNYIECPCCFQKHHKDHPCSCQDHKHWGYSHEDECKDKITEPRPVVRFGVLKWTY